MPNGFSNLLGLFLINMYVKSASLIYFSPTGTTSKVCKSIIDGMQLELVQTINLTKPQARKVEIAQIEGDVVVWGMPVYEERIPGVVQSIIESLKGNGKLS